MSGGGLREERNLHNGLLSELRNFCSEVIPHLGQRVKEIKQVKSTLLSDFYEKKKPAEEIAKAVGLKRPRITQIVKNGDFAKIHTEMQGHLKQERDEAGLASIARITNTEIPNIENLEGIGDSVIFFNYETFHFIKNFRHRSSIHVNFLRNLPFRITG